MWNTTEGHKRSVCFQREDSSNNVKNKICYVSNATRHTHRGRVSLTLTRRMWRCVGDERDERVSGLLRVKGREGRLVSGSCLSGGLEVPWSWLSARLAVVPKAGAPWKDKETRLKIEPENLQSHQVFQNLKLSSQQGDSVCLWKLYDTTKAPREVRLDCFSSYRASVFANVINKVNLWKPWGANEKEVFCFFFWLFWKINR